MKSIIIRSFLVAAVSLLLFQGLHAQRGRGYNRQYSRYDNNRHYNRYDHYRSRAYISFSSPRGGYYRYPGYYRPYGFYGSIGRPRIGIHINILPRGYSSFYLGNRPYYYYGGTYYRPGPRPDDYEVIDAPLGASVPELPERARVVVINEQKYYELDGTYYQEDIRDNKEIWYTVVGKNGRLNTDEGQVQDNGPAVGDLVDKLPDNCRTVTLNGTTYYVSPDDVYFEETMQQNTVRYRIVGK
jgi:hypothetical protein